MIKAARAVIGREALLHQDFSPHCWRKPDETLDACWQQGVGEQAFDCSGLIIYAARQVAGEQAWPNYLRHVRQLAAADEREVPGLRHTTTFGVGSLVLLRRQWTLPDGSHKYIAGHIGIKTGDTLDDMPILLHAATGTRKVVERPMRTCKNIMGGLVLDGTIFRATRPSTLDERVPNALS
jgi:hypothetical protein